jgi:glycolate oxidase
MSDPSNPQTALEQLHEQLGDCVKTSFEQREDHSYDGLKISCLPDAVIRVKEDSQVGIILKIADEYRIAVTTRGAGSSLTGGATPIQGGCLV